MSYGFTQINETHDTQGFRCGSNTLDAFIKNHALKNAHINLGRTYVLTEQDQPRVLGYYTLITTSIRRDILPESHPAPGPYDVFPGFQIGRLGVRKSHQGQGLGKLLLADSLERCFGHRKLLVDI